MPYRVNPKPVRVLIVDDDPAIVRIVEGTLNGAFPAAISTQIAFDGNQAESIMSSDSFDLIITDLDMPTTSGLHILMLAKQSNILTQVVILSCLSDVDTVRSAFKLGADEYLFKPMLPGQLVQSIKYYIERAARFRYIAQLLPIDPVTESPVPMSSSTSGPTAPSVT